MQYLKIDIIGFWMAYPLPKSGQVSPGIQVQFMIDST